MEYTDMQVRPMVGLRFDWPAFCSLSVGFPFSTSVGCSDAGLTVKSKEITLRSVFVPVRTQNPIPEAPQAVGCNWNDEVTVQNFTDLGVTAVPRAPTEFNCFGRWSQIRKGGIYTLDFGGSQVDAKDDGQSPKNVAGASVRFQELGGRFIILTNP
jgi:hypothetical protein